jgi:phosphate transport system substrate-binding protein
MKSCIAAILALLQAFTTVWAAPEVDPALPAYYASAAKLAGELHFSGGDTMRPLVESWARAFRGIHPQMTIRVAADVSLSADGFTALLAGRVDAATFVREAFPAELRDFTAKFGYPPLLINVAGGSYATQSGTHALAVFVNSANPLEHLTLTQLDAILSTDRRRGAPREITTWGQLGLTGEWGERPLHVYGMVHVRATGNPPGVVNFVQQRVLLGGEFRSDIHQEIDRPGASALAAIVQAIAADPAGIGYSGFGYAMPNTKTVALAESPASPFYAGTPEEVARRLYPLSRQIYLCVNRVPGQPLPPHIKEFIAFALSHQGQEAVAFDPMGFIPLTATQAAASRRQLE